MNEELKLCSICGSEGITKIYGTYEYVLCLNPDCPAMLPLEQWQSRPIEDDLRAENDVLKKKLEMAMGALNKIDNMPDTSLVGQNGYAPSWTARDALAAIEKVGK
jgi:hypothetical protein